MTILLIDDIPDILLVLSERFKDAGHEVVTACDGKDGLWKLAQATQPFDLIITDLQMPRIDGYEFAEQAKRMTDVPIILHTADIDAVATPHIDRVIDKFSYSQLESCLTDIEHPKESTL